MTKTEIYNKVSADVLELIEGSNLSKANQAKLMSIIDDNLKPKSGGGTTNPPKLVFPEGEDSIDGVMNHYCRFHNQYEPEENMVMSKGKSKGYCRASISKWNKTNSEIKKLQATASELMEDDDFAAAKEVVLMAKELKANLNNPEFYDFEADWANFNTPKEVK